jgi:hypothetical protein
MAGLSKAEREITIEEAIVLPGVWRNFEGRASDYNDEGDRNFSIMVDERLRDTLQALGYNPKLRTPKNDEQEPFWFLKITVKYGETKRPRIHTVTNGGKTITLLRENTVEILDSLEFETMDLTITPFDWEGFGTSGSAAYLKEAYVVPVESALDRKYAIAGNTADPEELG